MRVLRLRRLRSRRRTRSCYTAGRRPLEFTQKPERFQSSARTRTRNAPARCSRTDVRARVASVVPPMTTCVFATRRWQSVLRLRFNFMPVCHRDLVVTYQAASRARAARDDTLDKRVFANRRACVRIKCNRVRTLFGQLYHVCFARIMRSVRTGTTGSVRAPDARVHLFMRQSDGELCAFVCAFACAPSTNCPLAQ